MKKNSISFAKKLCAQILALAIIISAISCAFVSGLTVSAEGLDIWDGTEATEFAGGRGTEENPYKISTPEQLAYLVNTVTVGHGVNTVGKYFELTNDIYLNDVSAADWQTNAKQWYAFSTVDNLFAGTFNGNGYTVYGISRNDTPATSDGNNATALFPYALNDAKIYNVNIRNSYISGVNYAGGIIGKIYKENDETVTTNTVISGCSVDETVIKAYGAGGFIGGATGIKSYRLITIDNCWYKGASDAISGTYATVFTGGISNGYVKIKNSWFVSDKAATREATLVNVYGTTEGTYTNSTSVTVLSAEDMQGENAKTNMPALDWVLWDATEGYPTVNAIPLWYDKIWDGKTFAKPLGSGTKTDPYQIANGANLSWLFSETINSNRYNAHHYILTDDIYLNNVNVPDWQSKNPNSWYANDTSLLYGGIDGNGHAINGIYINNSTATKVGLVGRLGDSAYMKNLGIKNSYINVTTANSMAGAFAGEHYRTPGVTTSNVTFDNCYVDETVTVKAAKYASGFFAYGKKSTSSYKVTFNYCYYRGTADTLSASESKRPFTVAWGGYAYLNNSYFVSPYAPISENSASKVYGTTAYSGVTVLTEEQLTGENAKTNMVGFDFARLWNVVPNGYPTVNPMPENYDADAVWNGTSAQPSGSGTKDDPYLIENGKNLLWVYNTVVTKITANIYDAHYCKLTKDIYLNNTEDPEWMEKYPYEWPVSDKSRFLGGIDGNGYTIHGLYIDDSTTAYVGLFGQLGNSAYVKNLGIKDSYINATKSGSMAGAFAGYHWRNADSTNVTFDNCYVDETVTVKAAQYAAGFFAYGRATNASHKVTFNNCFYRGTADTLSASDSKRGFTAAWSGYVYLNNSYYVSNDAPITAGEVNKVYGTTSFTGSNGSVKVLTDAQMKGSEAQKSMDLDWTTEWKAVIGKYPVLRVFNDDSSVIWDGTVASDFAGGNGTADSPYIIETAAQLALMVSEPTNSYYELKGDIYLNNTIDPLWKEVSPKAWYTAVDTSSAFTGNLNGNGYTVYGIYVNDETNVYAGLFSVLGTAATVKNVGIEDAYINLANGTVGAIAGIATSTAVIDACYADESVALIGSTVGGIIGQGSDITVKDSYFTGSAQGTVQGGIIGTSTADDSVTTSYTVGYALTGNGSAETNGSYNTTDGDSVNAIKGNAAVETLSEFAFGTVWYPVENGYPQLIVKGRHTCDVDGNGDLDAGDLVAMQKHLLNADKYYLTDLTADGNTDVRDLVYLKKKVSQ